MITLTPPLNLVQGTTSLDPPSLPNSAPMRDEVNEMKSNQVESRGRVESRQVKSIPSQVKLSQVNSN